MSTNPYKLLRDLLPEPPLQVGTVSSYSSGSALVELPGGGTLNARGNASIGQRVYVRDSVIEGLAPTLPIELIEIT